MKGQLFSVDFLVALTLFFAVIAMAAYVWLALPDYRIYDFQERANSIAEFLVTHKFGEENILECSKLYDFVLKDYEDLRSELNVKPYHVWIKLKDVSLTTCPALRRDLDVMLVLDRSGSMAGQKMADLKVAAKFFVDKLDENYDQAGLVSYSRFATLDQTLLIMTAANKNTLKDNIDNLCGNFNLCSGSTNIGDAIAEATSELTSVRSREDAAKVQILLSDGIANEPWGEDPVQYTIDKAKEACLENIKIYTISLGGDANRALMQRVADITLGKEYYAPSSEDLQDIFDEISKEITVASDYGRIAPSSVKNLASIIRIVYLNGEKLQLIVRVYERAEGAEDGDGMCE